MNYKSLPLYLQAAIAALLYNLLHILAWELPIAVKLDWTVNIIGDIIIIAASVLSIILIALRKKAGLMLGFIPAFWAIFLQWFLIYGILGYKEPNGVWWYPLFPIFQGIMIVFFCVLAYRNIDRHSEPSQEIGNGLKSPSIYLYVISAFLIAHSFKKFVCEMVVGFRDDGIKGALVVAIIILIAFIAAAMVLKRKKRGVYLAIILGVIVMMQPLVYHVIMGKPCISGILWYPIFTGIQGIFIIYFSAITLMKEREIHASLQWQPR